MRQVALALVTLAVVTGCGTMPATTANAARTAGLQAKGLMEEGAITFDKDVITKTLDVMGIGPTYEKALAAEGIKTVKQLLLAGATPTGRKHLAAATGISAKLILTWVNHADLMRMTGCGPEYSRLLELAGVDSVLELARRNPTKLAVQLKISNELGGGNVAVKRVPDVKTTTGWIANAAAFARIVSY